MTNKTPSARVTQATVDGTLPESMSRRLFGQLLGLRTERRFGEQDLACLGTPADGGAFDTVAGLVAHVEGALDTAAFVRALMDDIGDKLNTEIDVAPYKQAVLQRFRNPAIRHLLAQIAWDGSQKLPNRLLPYIQEAAAFGWPLGNAARAVAAWFQFLRLRVRTGETLVDPLAPLLLATAARASGEAAHDVALFLELDAVFPAQLAGSELFRAALVDAYAQLGR